MKRKLRQFCGLFCVLTGLAAAPILAQETTGTIEGVVRDAQNAVVPNVPILITTSRRTSTGTTTTGTGAGFRRTITTDENGFFRALQIPPGNYDIIATATSGFGETRLENVVVAIGQATQLNVTLSPAGSSPVVVEVTASDAPPVDTTNNAVQTSINSEKIELLPRGVGITSVLRSVPGTRPESRSGGFSVDGASAAENIFVIDGQEVNNFRTGTLNENNNIPTQIVQEVQVKSSGFGAEFGGATGGVVSIVTKGGSNEFRGEFGMQFETPKLNGRVRPQLLRFASGTGAGFVQSTEYFTPRRVEGVNFFPSANLSGPIIKNRVYFYGSYTPQIFTTRTTTDFFTNAPAAARTLVETETFALRRRYEYAFGRIDITPTSRLRANVNYLWNPIDDRGNIPFGTASFGGVVPSVAYGGTIGNLRGRELTDRQGGRQSSNNLSMQANYAATDNISFSGRYSRGFLNEKLGNYYAVPGLQIVCQVGNTPQAPNTYPGGCPQGLTTSSNSETTRDVSIRTNYEGDVTFLTNLLGRHEIKSGYQRQQIFNDVAQGFVEKGRITFLYGTNIQLAGAGTVTPTPGNIGTGILRRQGTFGKASNRNQAIYIQDKYQPFKRLFLNLGVRVEKEDLPSYNSYAPPINFGWGDKIAPRFGFALDLTGRGNSKIFGSYGRFLDRLKFNIPRSSFGGDFFLEDFFELFPSDVYTQFTLENVLNGRSRFQRNLRVASNDPNASATSGGRVDPNLKPFSQTEITIGFEQQFARDFVFRTRYTNKNVDNAIEDAGIRNSLDSEEYIIGNPGEGLHLETLQRLGYAKSLRPQRRYDGLEFVLEKRLSNRWYFNANYTLSRLYGNYSGLSSSDEINASTGRLSPGTTRSFDLPFIGFTAAGEADNGRLETDRPHVFNAYGAYIFDWFGSKSNSTEISAFQTVTSGTPQTTRIFLVSTITPAIFTKRGDLGRSPTYSQTDINFVHRYRFGRDDRFSMVWDATISNLFDQDTVTNLYVIKNLNTSVITGSVLGFPNNGIAFTNAYTSGQLLNPINTFLAGNAANLNRLDARYGQPSTFQSPRSVRFGFRLLF